MRRTFWAVVNLLLLALLLVVGYIALFHRQDALDWWRLRNYTAPANVVQLANDDTMQGRGRELFYVSQPQVQSSAAFNKSCSNNSEQTVVLGCYAMQRIYIYNVPNVQLNGVQQVTAAHEMLHAAYERLDSATKNKVDQMLQAQMAALKNDAHLQSLIAIYNKQEPGELLNEMHSVLGTEYGNLSPDLENYYKQYFTDRSRVVTFKNQYESVFTASQQRISSDDTQLNSLKQQIDDNESQLSTMQQNLQQQSAQLDAERQRNPTAYNQAVPAYNQQVDQYNALVDQTKSLIDRYNTLVAQRNNEAAAQNNLYQSLNSKYQPAAAN